ncbi:MAG: M50 family metallopeptidase [Chloroflexota bacterium]|jgi:tetratricopeptide (TPR) repeat protein
MSVLTNLFNVLALLYIGRAVQLTAQVIRNWAEVRQEPLTKAKQRLADQAAFFIAVPPSVLFHELAHAAAIWLFGGQVVEFGYRVFWGYVIPAGDFTSVQYWFIAVAGPLGSLAFGAGVWLALRRNPSRSLQYFGLRTFRFQIYFSLIYYPLFSLVLPVGDWRIIYNFSATPILSGIAAILQAGTLVWFWRFERRGGFEMPAFESMADQAVYESARAAAAMGDEAAELQAIDFQRRGGARHQARTSLQAYLNHRPDSAAAYLQYAALLAGDQDSVSRDAAKAARRALEIGLSNPQQVAYAREIVATHYLERGDSHAAEEELDQALSVGADILQPVFRAELHALRSRSYRRQEKYSKAYQDIHTAIDLARSAGDNAAESRYTGELQVIEKNSRSHHRPFLDTDGQTTYLPPGSG